MKCLTIVGARPQFIKAAVVSKALSSLSNVQEIFLHTGQHYDQSMSEIFFEELDIPEPHYNLNVGSGAHGKQTGKMLMSIEEVLIEESPDIVVVYGDTNSTLAGGLAAAKLHIPIAHIEAGLRSFDRKMPEEVNRVLTDHLATILLTPTELAMKNLIKEGISGTAIHNVGDVMYDAALYFADKAERQSHVLKQLDIQPQEFLLATVHRAENTNNSNRLESIFSALIQISHKINVVVPLHPRTRKALKKAHLLEKVNKSLTVIDPVGYLDMILLEKNAALIATDSGGIQKEAFFYRVPCATLRENTEWEELVSLGWNTLVSPNNDSEQISDTLQSLIKTSGELDSEPYGNGRASQKISRILASQSY